MWRQIRFGYSEPGYPEPDGPPAAECSFGFCAIRAGNDSRSDTRQDVSTGSERTLERRQRTFRLYCRKQEASHSQQGSRPTSIHVSPLRRGSFAFPFTGRITPPRLVHALGQAVEQNGAGLYSEEPDLLRPHTI